MDADLFRFAEVWAAGGSPFSVFPIAPDRLRDISRATVEDLKVESGAAGGRCRMMEVPMEVNRRC